MMKALQLLACVLRVAVLINTYLSQEVLRNYPFVIEVMFPQKKALVLCFDVLLPPSLPKSTVL